MLPPHGIAHTAEEVDLRLVIYTLIDLNLKGCVEGRYIDSTINNSLRINTEGRNTKTSLSQNKLSNTAAVVIEDNNKLKHDFIRS